MGKALLAVVLGVVSFFVFMFVGEAVGLVAAFFAGAAFLFVCQFVLSRGHVDAHWNDWPIMVSLAAPPLVAMLLIALLERNEVFFTQGAPLILSALVGIYGGALAASLAARQAGKRSV